jgi:Na+-driven multidrug efflux pump
MLAALNVNPALRPNAASYVYWRGAIAWAALAQACSLQVMLATRDAVTPLIIVATAAALNIVGDALFCVWPFRWGCAGAAAATSLATLLSSGLMLVALKKKQLLPSVQIPKKKELMNLLEFTGPLLAITITRLIGFVAMQKRAMTLGLQPLAAYQLCINVVMFFLLFGEPLSQLSQTKLPPLVDAEDGDAILANLKSVLILGLGASIGVGACSFAAIRFGAALFTSDPTVQLMAHASAPAVFWAVSQAIMAVTVDGAMLASRDFGFMLAMGTLTCLVQLYTLNWCTTLTAIFGTFTFRLGSYTLAVLARVAMGKGDIGRAIKTSWKRKKAALQTS